MASLKPDWSQLLGEGEAQVQERQLARLVSVPTAHAP